MSPAAPAAMPGLRAFLRAGPDCLRTGPIALILVEDDAALAETVDHHARLGFRHILLASPEPLSDLPGPHRDRLTNVIWNTRRPAAHVEAVNLLIQAVPPGTWLYYGFNAEFLFYPFSDRRSVKEMLDFHGEERRSAMLSYVIDLYAPISAAAPTECRWTKRCLMAPVIARCHGMMILAGSWSGSWISMAACAGAMRNFCRAAG